MTDDERLLEIATRLMAASYANPKGPLRATGALLDAEVLIATWRTRTGAHEAREQDVSDELLQGLSEWLFDPWGSEEQQAMWREIRKIQGARAAEKEKK